MKSTVCSGQRVFTQNSTGADILPAQIASSLLRTPLRRAANRLRSSPWASGSPSPTVHRSVRTLHATMNQSVPKKVHRHSRVEPKRKKGGTVVWPSIFVGKRDGCVHATRAIRAFLDPRREGRRLAARMRELNADFRGLRVRKVDDSLERRDLRVRPKPRVLGRDAALGNDRGRFHDDAPRAARRKALYSTPGGTSVRS